MGLTLGNKTGQGKSKRTPATIVLALGVVAALVGLVAAPAQAATYSYGKTYPVSVPGPSVGQGYLTAGLNFVGLDGVGAWPGNKYADVNCIVNRDGSPQAVNSGKRSIAVRPPAFGYEPYNAAVTYDADGTVDAEGGNNARKVDIYTVLYKWDSSRQSWSQVVPAKRQTVYNWLLSAGIHEESFANLEWGAYHVEFAVVWSEPIYDDGQSFGGWKQVGFTFVDAGGYEVSVQGKAFAQLGGAGAILEEVNYTSYRDGTDGSSWWVSSSSKYCII